MDFAHVDLVIFCVYPGVKATVKKYHSLSSLKCLSSVRYAGLDVISQCVGLVEERQVKVQIDQYRLTLPCSRPILILCVLPASLLPPSLPHCSH